MFMAFRSSFPEHGDELDRAEPGNLDDSLYTWQARWLGSDVPPPGDQQAQFHKQFGRYVQSEPYRRMISAGMLCSSNGACGASSTAVALFL